MSVKKRVLSTLDQLARYTGLLRFFERRLRGQLTVLMYHRVLPEAECVDYPLRSLAVSQSAFEDHVRTLAARYEVLPLRDALRRLDQGVPTERPLLAMTFDDGYLDNYEIAAPILEQHELRGTFFVTAGLVGTKDLFWFDRAGFHWRERAESCRNVFSAVIESENSSSTLGQWVGSLKLVEPSERAEILRLLDLEGDVSTYSPAYSVMSPAQVRELHDRGHEIGSHTSQHPLLPQLSDDDLRSEIEGSRQTLRECVDATITGFCYPNGDHDDRVVEVTEKAGYAYACTTQEARYEGGNSFRIPRLDMNPSRLAGANGQASRTAFRAEVCGWHARLRRLLAG